jgi:AcrR family transcriptional regulator
MSARPTESGRGRRVPLTRERVLQTAMRMADDGGLDALSMRKLGEELGVEAMALYHHFANKSRVLDGLVDLVFAEIAVPDPTDLWSTAMRRRGTAVRDALLRHRWAIGLMESRRHPGPANLRHHDAVLGCLRGSGFTVEQAAHAYSVLDSYIYGFALTKMNLPFDVSDDAADVAQNMLEPFPTNEYPHLMEFVAAHVAKPGYDYADEFDYGLELVLDGLERELAPERPSHRPIASNAGSARGGPGIKASST